MPGAQLAEGELQEDPGLPETGGGLEEHERMAFELGGELGLGPFLAGSRGRKGRLVAQAAEALARPQAQAEEFGDAFELDAEQAIVGRRERQRLREAGVGFDKHQFEAGRGVGPRCGPQQGGVGGELDEIVGVLGAEFGFVRRQGAGDGLDFAQRDAARVAEDLVDAAGEREGPAAMNDRALDRNLELGAGVLGERARTKLAVPVGAELRAPQAGGPAFAGCARPE